METRVVRARRLESLTLALVSLIGITAFLLPFLTALASPLIASSAPRVPEASLLLAALVAGTLAVSVSELALGPAEGSLSRSIALLAALVAVDAALRLIPTFLGASPIFALIVLVGYVFGARFGFVMGALTLLLSAAITAGVGPWLPFQMLCAGWTGLAAGHLPHKRGTRNELAIVAVFAGVAGFAYGALMNLYAWPFSAPGAASDVGLYWSPTLSLGESLHHYAAFYAITSLVYDAARAAGNVALVLVAGGLVLSLLRRFQARASWKSSAA